MKLINKIKKLFCVPQIDFKELDKTLLKSDEII